MLHVADLYVFHCCARFGYHVFNNYINSLAGTHMQSLIIAFHWDNLNIT